jgi:hypothetical protein
MSFDLQVSVFISLNDFGEDVCRNAQRPIVGGTADHQKVTVL